MLNPKDYKILNLNDQESLLLLSGNHRVFKVDRDLGSRLEQLGTKGMEESEAAEWSFLERVGLVSNENPDVLRRSSFEDGAHLAINVNLTHACNLACTYCFAEGGDYGRMTHPMTAESVDQIFAFIDDNVTESDTVRFEFFGGEPLANPRIIEQICDRSERLATNTSLRFLYRISTNLTLLPKRVLARFARHNFVVSVSLDGGPEIQDRFRPTRGGRGSFQRIVANVEKVRAASEAITLVARMTVASSQPSLVERVKGLWALNVFDYFQIYPAVYRASGDDISATGCADAPGDGPVVNYFLHDDMPAQFREFLEAYPTFFADDNRFKGVLEYERTAEMILEGKIALAFCSGGRVYYTHSPNGVISPCHRLAGDESFDVGEGSKGITTDHDEWRDSVDNHPECSQCWARYICGGGCKQENHLATGDLNRLNQDSCSYQLMLAEEVIKMAARAPTRYRKRDRQAFRDLFVSCGRPVARNARAAELSNFELHHFRPLESQAPTVTAAA